MAGLPWRYLNPAQEVTMWSNGNSFSGQSSLGLGTEVREPWLVRACGGTGEHWA